MLSAIAATKNGFFQIGSRNKLSFSESEFIALNISTVTRIDRLIVVARCAMTFVNISHPISGNSAEHWWKCVCGHGHPLSKSDNKTRIQINAPVGNTRSAGRRRST